MPSGLQQLMFVAGEFAHRMLGLVLSKAGFAHPGSLVEKYNFVPVYTLCQREDLQSSLGPDFSLCCCFLSQ